MATQPVLWVSACLLGNAVRYDGGHKDQPGLRQWLETWARVLPLCPEVFAGLGTPRPPIQREQTTGGERLVLAHSGEPTADGLAVACAQLVNQQARPAGAILKARSPSCGAGNSPLYDRQQALVNLGDGVFVQALKQRYRSVVIVNEEQLLAEADRLAFYHQVMAAE